MTSSKILDFAALALKGQVEHGQTGAYFASFGGLRYYVDQAISRGWLMSTSDGHNSVTAAGLEHYQSSGLDLVGRTDSAIVPPKFGEKGSVRGYMMDWSMYKPEVKP